MKDTVASGFIYTIEKDADLVYRDRTGRIDIYNDIESARKQRDKLNAIPVLLASNPWYVVQYEVSLPRKV